MKKENNMACTVVENEIVVLYDRLHEFYVDSIRFHDAFPTDQDLEKVDRLYSVLDSVNECIKQIAFGGMGTFNFLEEVNLNELYSIVFLIASGIQNVVINGPNCDDLIKLQKKICNRVDTIYTATNDVLKIFAEICHN